MRLKELKQKLLKDPEFRKEYERPDLQFDIGLKVMEARIKKGLTQNQLAKKVGTKQPSIARLESGSSLPSMKFLERIAEALELKLNIELTEALEDMSPETDSVNETWEEQDDVPVSAYIMIQTQVTPKSNAVDQGNNNSVLMPGRLVNTKQMLNS